ncbi:MAG: DNA repair protein RecN [Balneolales bacterium]|nr:DNA repair protein RecN [Balneolales bacterium]
MIESIYVKDFALIDELEVNPGAGLNIITGQTGAGKSILIGALNMILGERADTDTIRHGAQKAVAEALIRVGNNDQIRKVLEEAEVEFRNVLILRREIRSAASRAFVNDTPVPVGVLKKIGDLLVDLHGQHDHQLLLKEEHHREVVDGLQQVRPHLEAWQQQYREVVAIRKSLSTLRKQEKDLQEKQELYRFQLKELETVQPDVEEYEQMEQEMRLLDNAEELDQKAALVVQAGSESEVNIEDLLTIMGTALEDLAAIENGFEGYVQEFNAARISIREAVRFAERYRSGIEFNPQRLEFLRKRQSDLRKLEKKYGKSIEELCEYMNELRSNLNLADNYDIEIEKLENKVAQALDVLKEKATKLHEARVNASQKLGEQIVGELQKLGIVHARFETRVDWLVDTGGWIEIDEQRVACTEFGSDDVRFFISTNKGEVPKPLSKTASGGEISRIMLALKSILAMEQSLPVMIFDEIDTGISGEVAEQVGQTMRRLATKCQILAITHQPQIASQAHHHFKVSKQEEEERTITYIHKLDDEEHIREVATLMSGAKVSEAALKSARELVESVSLNYAPPSDGDVKP